MTQYDETLRDVRTRLAILAASYLQWLTPQDVAKSLIGAGFTVMHKDAGAAFTAAYFHAIGTGVEKISDGKESDTDETGETQDAVPIVN